MHGQGRVRNITELARLAGVSPGTVSRALADSQLIAKKTRERIQEIAREHDFRPNVMARNLRIKRAGAIGILIPLGHETGARTSDQFFINMLGHLADALTERGHDLLLSRVVPKDSDWLSRVVDSGRVDGVILIGQSDQIEAIDKVASRYLPLVAWGANVPEQVHCSVGSDNRRGGKLAVQHLIEQGCRSFAFLGDLTVPEISERLTGCKDALQTAGLSDTLSILQVDLAAENADQIISKWLDENRDIPEGLIAASDAIAISVIRVLADRKIDIPGQVRVIGYDDLLFINQAVPTLSTVCPNLAAGAKHLVDLLFRRIDGEDISSMMLEPQLVVRQST